LFLLRKLDSGINLITDSIFGFSFPVREGDTGHSLKTSKFELKPRKRGAIKKERKKQRTKVSERGFSITFFLWESRDYFYTTKINFCRTGILEARKCF
jgi:hypothetical protein